MLRSFLFSLSLILCTSILPAQIGYEFGGFLGAGWYFGDLNPDFSLNHPGPAIGLIGRHNFNDRIGLALTGNYTFVEGNDAWSENPYQRARNLSFRSNIFDFGGRFEFNFMRYKHGSQDYWFTPYVFGGISVFVFNPKAELNGEWYALRDLGTEGQFTGEEYYILQPALNYGLGLKFDLSYEWSINIEIDARKLWTDYLDDVSSVYADKLEIDALRGPIAVALSDRSIPDSNFPQIGEAGRQRGDSQNNDIYGMVKVGLVYYFGEIRCPEILY